MACVTGLANALSTASLLSGTLHFRRHQQECLASCNSARLREYLDNERRHLGVFVAYSWVEALVPLTLVECVAASGSNSARQFVYNECVLDVTEI